MSEILCILRLHFHPPPSTEQLIESDNSGEEASLCSGTVSVQLAAVSLYDYNNFDAAQYLLDIFPLRITPVQIPVLIRQVTVS